MGEKRTGAGKRFYVFLAFLTTILCGCATITDFENRYTAREHLRIGEQFFAQENFERALQESEEALTLSPKSPPGDSALFMMGLIHAHHNNPAQSYKTAQVFFEQVITDFPASMAAEQAKMWVAVLIEVRKRRKPVRRISAPQTSEPQEPTIQMTQADKHLESGQELLARKQFDKALEEYQRVLVLAPHRSPGDYALFDMGLVFAYSDNPNRDYKTAGEFFRMLVDKFPESPLIDQARAWVNVLQTIEKAKQVDIEIEEKKKELAR